VQLHVGVKPQSLMTVWLSLSRREGISEPLPNRRGSSLSKGTKEVPHVQSTLFVKSNYATAALVYPVTYPIRCLLTLIVAEWTGFCGKDASQCAEWS
jgi:hypothetical protein